LHVAGGDVVQLKKTSQALERLGIEVRVRLANELEGEGWCYDLVHVFNIQNAAESWQVCETVKEHGLPLVLSPIYWDPLPLWFWQAPRKSRRWRFVRTMLGYHMSSAVYYSWQRWRYPSRPHWQLQREMLTSADALLPNSKLEAMHLIGDFRLRSDAWDKMTIVPNAVDRTLFDPVQAPSASVLQQLDPLKGFVLEVGRVSPEKNSLQLIGALWDIPVPIVFIGQSSPYDLEYVVACHRRALRRGNVYFIERIPNEELPAIYALAAVHALPSWRETPGLASLEAAAAGCRVVSTSVGSAHEYFGEQAWYCHPADRNSIRRAVLSALAAPCSAELRRRVLERYTWDIAAAATRSAYQSALRRWTPSTGRA
jgi:glycosyltransferase involved in cell wall biosynthesis